MLTVECHLCNLINRDTKNFSKDDRHASFYDFLHQFLLQCQFCHGAEVIGDLASEHWRRRR